MMHWELVNLLFSVGTVNAQLTGINQALLVFNNARYSKPTTVTAVSTPFKMGELAGRAFDKCAAMEIFTIREHSHLVAVSLLLELMLAEGGGSPQ